MNHINSVLDNTRNFQEMCWSHSLVYKGKAVSSFSYDSIFITAEIE